MKKNNKTAIVKAIDALFPPERTDLNSIEFTSNQTISRKDAVSFEDNSSIQATSINEGSSIKEQRIDWNIAEIKRKISEFTQQGKLSSDLLDVLCKNSLCAPIEFECLDYKEGIDKTPHAKGKLVQRVVSFYNTFGGYLVFGVAEIEPETRFDVVGMPSSELDVESLKASIKEFTGERIQVTLMSFEAADTNGKPVPLSFLHIPKRPQANPPLHFLKNGPGNDQKKPIFLKDEVYCRRGDECVEAKGPRILELNGERLNPYLTNGGAALAAMIRVNRIHHNLPDRNFICPKFIGREKSVDALWRWLGDDLSHVKVLAGEGGLGKSSIAFEFAERVSEARDATFDQVIWLTAKEQQFNALEDKYVRVAERHYTSYDELLHAICERLPFTNEELDGATSIELRRMLKKGLAQVATLIIIDDVDSLPSEEQRQVLELGMIMGSSVSRLLLTTRFNQSYSLDTVIKISGFALEEEFPAYVESLRERLEFPVLKPNEIEKIHSVSGGSPLFTESLLRLLRWNTVGEAISSWKNERGSAVRAAALKREIELLSSEGQRILFAIAMLGEASKVELCEVLGYISDVVEGGLNTLQSLFLVAAPALASIPRFRVPDNTRRLVLDPTTCLVTDRVRLQKEIEDFRRKADRTPTKDSRVAAAISQAESLCRVGELSTALETIKEARRRTQDHFDLLCYQANLYLKEDPPQIDEARRLARKAYTKGCRKSEVFQYWFQAEWLAQHYIGALEAAEAALLNKSPSPQDWLIRKSAALASKATDQSKSKSIGGAVSTMFEASEVLRNAITKSRRDDGADLESRQAILHDQIWLWAGLEDTGLGKTNAQIDALEKMWRFGDVRITNLRRMLSALANMTLSIERKINHISTSQRNLFEALISRGRALHAVRQQRFPGDLRHKDITCSLESLLNRASEAIAHTPVHSDFRPDELAG